MPGLNRLLSAFLSARTTKLVVPGTVTGSVTLLGCEGNLASLASAGSARY